MKTILQIAKEIGIDKQRVYRYIKKHRIIEAHQKRGVMYYDDVVELRIKRHFSEVHASSEAHHETRPTTPNDTMISISKSEWDFKNQLINEQQQTIREQNETIKLQARNIDKNQNKGTYYREKVAFRKEPNHAVKRLQEYAKEGAGDGLKLP